MKESMLKKLLIIFILFLFPKNLYAEGYDVFSIGLYDIKFDGSQTNQATDLVFDVSNGVLASNTFEKESAKDLLVELDLQKNNQFRMFLVK